MAPLTPRDHGKYRAFWSTAINDMPVAPSPYEISVGTDLNRAVRNTRMRRQALARQRFWYKDDPIEPGSIILVDDKDVDELRIKGYIELLPEEQDWTSGLSIDDEDQREEELAEMHERWQRAKRHRP